MNKFSDKNHVLLKIGLSQILWFSVSIVTLIIASSISFASGDFTINSGNFSAIPTWRQNFSVMDNGRPDSAIWRNELNPQIPSYNNENQGYTNKPGNVRIVNGRLVLEARKEAFKYPNDPEGRVFEFTSGRIDTLNSLNFEYGKLEVTAKLPAGKTTWPAIWLLSANNVHTKKLNPTSTDWAQENYYKKDGEIDIVEMYGNAPGVIEATVHTFAQTSEGHATVADFATDFNTYGVELTPSKIVWTVNGRPYHTFEKHSDNTDEWPFKDGNQMYLILNLAMGGPAGKIEDSNGPWRMEVRDVKYYKYIANN